MPETPPFLVSSCFQHCARLNPKPCGHSPTALAAACLQSPALSLLPRPRLSGSSAERAELIPQGLPLPAPPQHFVPGQRHPALCLRITEPLLPPQAGPVCGTTTSLTRSRNPSPGTHSSGQVSEVMLM